MNPIQFIPDLFITNRFSYEEQMIITEITEKFEDCRFFLKICSALKLIDVGPLSAEVYDSLGEFEKANLMQMQKNYYDEIFDIYFGTIDVNLID